jgi:hypothetical protein
MRAGSNNIAPLVWALLSLERGCAAPRKILGIETPVRVGCHVGLVMSDRTKLMMASLTILMLPYRIDIPVTCLMVTATVCTAIDMAMERRGPGFSWLSFLATAVSTVVHYPIANSPRGNHAGRTSSEAP